MKKNVVGGLFNDRGEWVTSDSALTELATAYFKDLFATSNPSGATKGLSAMLNAASRNKVIKGATIGRRRLEVGHLLFADDSILFCEASIVAANALKRVLSTFGNASGQRVNFEKSLIFYSRNVNDELRIEIGSLLVVRVSSNPERYLGLPTMVSALESLFDEEYVNKISAIPLSNSGLRDEVVWRHDGLGCYTVKSGYLLLLKELNAAPLLPVISSPDFSNFYSALWASNLPPKVNITMWRIANNYLPTLANLHLRRLNVDTHCPLCKSATESIDHIMRDCEFVQRILLAQGVCCSVPVAGLT
ncbi:hypothetical protein V6N13_025320 [Hibiscus sabdariffa]